LSKGGIGTLGALLLLVGGLVHVMPNVLEPLVQAASVGFITLQLIIGVLSVAIALYILLGRSQTS